MKIGKNRGALYMSTYGSLLLRIFREMVSSCYDSREGTNIKRTRHNVTSHVCCCYCSFNFYMFRLPDRRTDRHTDRQTDRLTDGRTDR